MKFSPFEDRNKQENCDDEDEGISPKRVSEEAKQKMAQRLAEYRKNNFDNGGKTK